MMLLFSFMFSLMKHSGQEVAHFPPFRLFLIRSSWSMATAWQEGGLSETLSLEKVLWQEPWDTSVVVCWRPQEPSSPRKHSLTGSWPRPSSLKTLFFSKCLEEKDYENPRSMRGPGMSGPPLLPGKNLYTLVLYNN